MQHSTYEFNAVSLRTIIAENGETWFRASDVARLLGFNGSSRLLAKLEDDEHKEFEEVDGHLTVIYPIISESGFYSLILQSRRPEVKGIRRWVCREVLPSMRTQTKPKQLPQTFVQDIKKLTDIDPLTLLNSILVSEMSHPKEALELNNSNLTKKDHRIVQAATDIIQAAMEDELHVLEVAKYLHVADAALDIVKKIHVRDLHKLHKKVENLWKKHSPTKPPQTVMLNDFYEGE
jgi:prophage antirepressor-like protein